MESVKRSSRIVSSRFWRNRRIRQLPRWQQLMPSHCALLQKRQSTDEALQLIAPVEEEIRSIVGEFIYRNG